MATFIQGHVYYRLRENKLNTATGTKTYTGQVVVKEPLSEDQFIAKMMLIDPMQSVEKLKALFALIIKTAVMVTEEGYTFETSFMRTNLAVLETCTEEQKVSDPNPLKRASINTPVVAVLKDATLKLKTIQDSSAAKITDPTLDSITDKKSKTIDTQVTIGGMAELKGHHLKFDEADPKQGVFFVPVDGSSAIKAIDLGRAMPSDILFTVPALTIGEAYMVEVRCIAVGSTILKTAVLPNTVMAK